jgi:hypothetical protein
MADLLLRDIDPILTERIARVAAARGWTVSYTALYLLEQGLYACEQEVSGGLANREVDALADAIAALKQLPAGHRL